MRTAMWVTLAAYACLLTQAVAAPPLRAPIGRFDSKGRYSSPRSTEKFLKLHRAPTPRPQYPVVLVHGIVGWKRMRVGPFFADYFNGIRGALESQGIQVLVTRQTNFESVEARAQQVKTQVEKFMAKTGSSKVNLVAHSMGGIDCRYLISRLDFGSQVASLTTVSSPHHGSWFADFFLDWVWEKQHLGKIWKKLGIPHQAIPDMSVKKMREEFNPATPDHPEVRYFSFSAKQPAYQIPPPLSTMKIVTSLVEKAAVKKRWSLKDRIQARLVFPKSARKKLKHDAASLLGRSDWVKPEFAGKNDGIIPTSSAIWGEHLGTLDADHFELVGWFGSFRAKRLYRGIARMLADAGF